MLKQTLIKVKTTFNISTIINNKICDIGLNFMTMWKDSEKPEPESVSVMLYTSFLFRYRKRVLSLGFTLNWLNPLHKPALVVVIAVVEVK